MTEASFVVRGQLSFLQYLNPSSVVCHKHTTKGRELASPSEMPASDSLVKHDGNCTVSLHSHLVELLGFCTSAFETLPGDYTRQSPFIERV